MTTGKSHRLGITPTNYKGNDACYTTKHQWVYYHFGKANKCENKNCPCPNHTRYHWANLSGEYTRDRNDWIQLCPPCHKKMDYRPKNYCRKGHFLEEVGILIDSRGSRICKECKRINARKDYEKHREAIIARVTLRRKIRSSLRQYEEDSNAKE